MPYIITVSPQQYKKSRIATATLDEAREAVRRVLEPYDAKAVPAPDNDLDDYSRAYFSACADGELLDKSGDTFNLPDGTIIDVREVDMYEIATQAFERDDRSGSWPAPSIIIAAFNERNK